jgi:hypothetical protein
MQRCGPGPAAHSCLTISQASPLDLYDGQPHSNPRLLGQILARLPHRSHNLRRHQLSALDDIDLLGPSVQTLLASVADNEQKVLDALQTSAATPLVQALRVFRLQRAIMAVGIYSLFESMLQAKMNWDQPFDQLKCHPSAQAQQELMNKFEEYRLAINVLKHGRGRSYEELCKRTTALEFRVKLPKEAFFFEGDVSEVESLIDVDNTFVQRCAEIVGSVLSILPVEAS